jgi:hypothetical protein
LNPPGHAGTGTMFCFDGLAPWSVSGADAPMPMTFVEISDCRHKVLVNKHQHESIESFVTKLLIMSRELHDFAKYLHENSKPQSSLEPVPEPEEAK